MVDNNLSAYKRFFNKLKATYIEFYIKAPNYWNIDKTRY